MNTIETTHSGIKCDNPNCSYTDKTATFETYHNYLNKPCPNCGENLLTEDDFNRAEAIRLAVDIVNSLPKELLEQLSGDITPERIEELKSSPMFADAIGKENLAEGNKIIVSIETHKEVKVTEIKKVD